MKRLSIIFAILFFSISFSFAQSPNEDLCKDGDCPSEIFSINIDAPLGGVVATERTEKFKNAYLKFKPLFNDKKQDSDWASKYHSNALGGKSCMRMNQLQAYFAYEYERNADFKTFINAVESNSEAFMENGFQGSRRAINLQTRMKSKCSDEMKKIREARHPSVDDIPQIYQKLGIELGYFDEKGNVLKPMQDLSKLADQKAEELNNKIDELKPEEELKSKLNDCNEGLKKLLADIQKVETKQKKSKSRFRKLLDIPGKVLVKVSDLNTRLKELKLPLDGIPVVGNVLSVLDTLLTKTELVTSTIEKIKSKESEIQKKLDGIDEKIGKVKKLYDGKALKLGELDKELIELIAEKSGVKEKIRNGEADASELEKMVKDYIEHQEVFELNSDCGDQKEVEDEVDDLKEEQKEMDEEINDHEEEIKKVEKDNEGLENETNEIEKEIKEEAEKAAKLKEEEEAIKEEYGQDIKLEPVPIEEWSESFEVERTYWDAVFYPDDEVVEGYRGRYFEVRLKDAEKNVKLLFGPGEYFMEKSDFRKSYGSTIGAFVTEALHSMKKSDQKKVILFIQGSADIVGQKTFSGNLDDNYLYEEITVLPQKNNSDSFSGKAENRQVPTKGFRNQDLPNLRGQYLKEMISVYSKKLEPVLLEGAVKENEDAGERNAIIYLFIPEELTGED